MDALQKEMDFWTGLGVKVDWFVSPDRAEAMGIVDGDVWNIWMDMHGVAHTQSATLGDWTTGIEV